MLKPLSTAADMSERIKSGMRYSTCIWRESQKGASMYELIILALLMRMPFHGYLIAKITNDMIGPMAKLSSGTLYPLLTKLEQNGLIEIAPEEGEQSKGERHLRTF